MYKHQLVHDKSSVACEECKRRFRSPSKLQAHRAREHGYVLNELPGVQTVREGMVTPMMRMGGGGSELWLRRGKWRGGLQGL